MIYVLSMGPRVDPFSVRQRVVVIGNANSANEMAAQLAPVAQLPVYRSTRRVSIFPSLPDDRIEDVGPVLRYSQSANGNFTVHLKDGTIDDVDYILFGTGYCPEVPYLRVLDPTVAATHPARAQKERHAHWSLSPIGASNPFAFLCSTDTYYMPITLPWHSSAPWCPSYPSQWQISRARGWHWSGHLHAGSTYHTRSRRDWQTNKPDCKRSTNSDRKRITRLTSSRFISSDATNCRMPRRREQRSCRRHRSSGVSSLRGTMSKTRGVLQCMVPSWTVCMPSLARKRMVYCDPPCDILPLKCSSRMFPNPEGLQAYLGTTYR